MHEPEVSVLVVAYNQERFIEECLRSILSQDHPDFEVVVTDDASTDRTVEIVRRLAKDHPNLRVLTAERNGGVSRNANRGLRECRGRFVAALGGDDLALPGKLRLQAEVLRGRPEVTLCYHDMEVFFEDGGKAPYLYSTSRKPREGSATGLVRHGNCVVGSSPMLRASAIPPGGIPEELPVMGDWFFFIAVARRGRIAYLPQVLGRYRRHGESVLMRRLAGQDPLVTLDLVERRFPELARHARWRRGELLRQEARRSVGTDPALVARLARRALGQRKVWRPAELAWLLLAAAGRLPSQRRARMALGARGRGKG